jgi:glycosyltransferase involved in cell wall biosynthesis
MTIGFVSVLMSVKNCEKEVYNSVESILNQTYENFEFLIVDDASTDNTLKILNKFKDKRIKIYENKSNIGLTKSLNYLIKKSRGQFIARQDADDVSLPNRFEKQLDFLKKNNIKVCTTRAIIKNSSRKIPALSFYIPKKILIRYKNPFIHGTLLIERDLLNKMGNYDENFYYSQDYDLFSRLIQSKYLVKTLREPLFVLNTTNNISTFKKQEQQYFADCLKRRKEPNL